MATYGSLNCLLMNTKVVFSPDRSGILLLLQKIERIAGRHVLKISKCCAANYSKRMALDGVILVIIKEGISKTSRQITIVPMLSSKM